MLCDAAMRGDVGSLKEIIANDEYILDKVLVGGFKGKNPLHVAISTGQREFALELLRTKPELAEVLDTELGTALHIASSKGHVEIVEHLVENIPGMCMTRNREGNNPLHIAAMKGKVEVLKVLLRTSPQAAQVRVDQGYTILHLCVNYNQLASLKELLHVFLFDPDFVASTDTNGNNILHLAVLGKRYQIVEHVLRNTEIDVNARNGSGSTVRDIYSRIMRISINHGHVVYDSRVRGVLHEKGAKRSDRLFFPFDPSWQKKKKDTLMIVSSLMATMAFQVGVNPPGGVWQDTSKLEDPLPHHVAGKAITATYYPNFYYNFLYVNTVGFLLSLTTILELIVVLPDKKKAFGFIEAGISWLAIMTMVYAYTFSIFVVSPTEEYESVNLAILVIVALWVTGISLLHVAPYVVKEKLVNAILVTLILPFECRAYIRDCKETVQSPSNTASTADPNAVGEENDAGV
ncbi:hypothetical protein Vadar_017765 [Vaccinium darrowii]|uniref:Uncharacterized protein n=1 Tax=Vaccinium darrowii TaxID=229202 RepID=A0ACB7Z4H7_9ERIC|nr:hypothetical protein Vadar_017765 [Vaccinium darrowii]